MAKSTKKAGNADIPAASTRRTGTKKPLSKKTATKKGVISAASASENDVDAQVLDRLYTTVLARRGTDPGNSHSARLLARGRRKIAQKFGEEAIECLIEAVAGNQHELIGESADVLYHLIVMWVDAGVTPDNVWQELKRRQGISGVAEKASRPHDPLAV